MKDDCLQPGTLWSCIVDATDHALACGALLPIDTNTEFVTEGGVRFIARVATQLQCKDQARPALSAAVNPFLPPDENLFVARITPTHVGLLNRFNVVEHHLLIVTETFEPQENLLGLEDFEALWTCLREFDGLGFYNGGETAGASQPHKHLQLVPLPLAAVAVTTAGQQSSTRLPMEALLEPLLAGPADSAPGLPVVPFRHAISRLKLDQQAPLRDATRHLREHYSALLSEVGLAPDPSSPHSQIQRGPYNLLVTREWMMVVPRTREFCGSVSLNALAFAGSLFVRNQQQLRELEQFGLMAALRHVTAAL